MATISMSTDLKAVKKQLTRLQRKQIPYAAKNALNDVAFEARKAEQKAQANYIDRPVAFTKSGLKVTKANKNNLMARIEVPANRWKYLKYQVEGGVSKRQGTSHAIPLTPEVQNKFGGMTRNKSRTLLKRKGHFKARSGSNTFLFKRTGRSVKPLVMYKDSTTHTPSYPLWKATTRLVEAKFKHRLATRLSQALRTAR